MITNKFRKYKGQAAIEYLVTYGWAFLVIIGAISALSYFGLLNPERYIPNSCDFGEQLKCVDQYIDDSGRIILRFRNNFEDAIVINATSGDDISSFVGQTGGSGVPVTVERGEIRQIEVTTDRSLNVNKKERFTIQFTFRRDGGTVPHQLSGIVFTEVVDSSLGVI